MPNGHKRQLITKASLQKDAVEGVKDFWGDPVQAANANIHAFLPNNPDLGEFSTKDMVFSENTKMLLPSAFMGAERKTTTHSHR